MTVRYHMGVGQHHGRRCSLPQMGAPPHPAMDRGAASPHLSRTEYRNHQRRRPHAVSGATHTGLPIERHGNLSSPASRPGYTLAGSSGRSVQAHEDTRVPDHLRHSESRPTETSERTVRVRPCSRAMLRRDAECPSPTSRPCVGTSMSVGWIGRSARCQSQPPAGHLSASRCRGTVMTSCHCPTRPDGSYHCVPVYAARPVRCEHRRGHAG